MLVVGKVGGWGGTLHDSQLTADEQYTHISLWALLAAPLLIGCDISQIDDFTFNLLCNNEVIAVDQDILGKQAKQEIVDGEIQIWKRPLYDGSYAVGIFNLGNRFAKGNFAIKASKIVAMADAIAVSVNTPALSMPVVLRIIGFTANI